MQRVLREEEWEGGRRFLIKLGVVGGAVKGVLEWQMTLGCVGTKQCLCHVVEIVEGREGRRGVLMWTDA